MQSADRHVAPLTLVQRNKIGFSGFVAIELFADCTSRLLLRGVHPVHRQGPGRPGLSPEGERGGGGDVDGERAGQGAGDGHDVVVLQAVGCGCGDGDGADAAAVVRGDGGGHRLRVADSHTSAPRHKIRHIRPSCVRSQVQHRGALPGGRVGSVACRPVGMGNALHGDGVPVAERMRRPCRQHGIRRRQRRHDRHGGPAVRHREHPGIPVVARHAEVPGGGVEDVVRGQALRGGARASHQEASGLVLVHDVPPTQPVVIIVQHSTRLPDLNLVQAQGHRGLPGPGVPGALHVHRRVVPLAEAVRPHAAPGALQGALVLLEVRGQGGQGDGRRARGRGAGPADVGLSCRVRWYS
mmetsp:Transcript_8505/g.21339  ORF Transcript_8505/g.21339 Transcript_8505/m.21339 type:complete len:353 (-) Transcript_8505:3240-4298(-)